MWEAVIPTIFLFILVCPHISYFTVRQNLCLSRELTALLLSYSCGKSNVITFCACDPSCVHSLLKILLFGYQWYLPLDSSKDSSILWKLIIRVENLSMNKHRFAFELSLSVFHTSTKRGAVPFCRGKYVNHIWTVILVNEPKKEKRK